MTAPRTRLAVEPLEAREVPAGVYPNDPEFATQWWLHNTGQSGGVYDADMDLPAAWSISTGSMATVVAILDNGVDYTEADLYRTLWLNEGEIPTGFGLVDTDSDGLLTFRDLNGGANASFVTDVNGNGYVDGGDLLSDTRWENGIDEDGNGKVDDLIGWDFHDNDNDPYANVAVADHGTRMARDIGAMTDNGLGSAGINWAVRMIPVRIRPDVGSASGVVDVIGAAGLDYAVAAGAPISNNSWIGAGGGYNFSQVMFDAISRARQAGHLFIAPAGNDATDNDATPLYPASYDLDNVISVTGVDASNQTGGTWNYGLNSVDLGASCDGGTSRASSRTTGVAALLKTIHPDWTYSQIKNQLMSTVDPLPSLNGKTVTGGRVNAAKALGIVYSTSFYVPNDAATNQTFEYDRSDELMESYTLAAANTAPRGAASTAAGTTVWVVDANRKVYVYDSSGALLGSWTAGSMNPSAAPEGIATDGTDIWIVDGKGDKVFRYSGAANRLTGSQNAASSFSLNSGSKNPKGIVTDGISLWVVNDSSTDMVFKYSLTGSFLGSWTMTGGGGSPTGITLDPSAPSHLWVVDNASDRVYQFDAAVGRTSGSQAASLSFALAAGNTNPQGIADPSVPGPGGPVATSLPVARLAWTAEVEEEMQSESAPPVLLARSGPRPVPADKEEVAALESEWDGWTQSDFRAAISRVSADWAPAEDFEFAPVVVG